MKNSVIFLSRRCPRNCSYCSIRSNEDTKSKELSIEEWKKAFDILDSLGVTLYLVLGNEPWVLGKGLVELFKGRSTPAGIYTSCIPVLFEKYKDYFFSSGINNLSCGIDFPFNSQSETMFTDDSFMKSKDAWKSLEWTRQNYPNIVCHATITVHQQNFRFLEEILEQCDAWNIFSNVNFLHWDIDGQYDFCSRKEDMENLMIPKSAYFEISRILQKVRKKINLLQNKRMLERPVSLLANMKGHCKGDPYGAPTIDADGTLRVCGYRKGARTSLLSIFDLPKKEKEWKKAVYDDAMECPGCSWSCVWMYKYWMITNPETGKKVFTEHKIA